MPHKNEQPHTTSERETRRRRDCKRCIGGSRPRKNKPNKNIWPPFPFPPPTLHIAIPSPTPTYSPQPTNLQSTYENTEKNTVKRRKKVTPQHQCPCT
ncbi:hypothetical protein BJ508DRAFT_174585 [Ascobolus immersus RN42]|uniref:Uncharacterized protein n=1 Tax=Ascobolus immersus RN42 TaxID=1160509 RepID=A0A3N4HTQ6_ASCIM|nr:hypothetical protein BJ508DRAFT_174585 [Ascobolus immersus RN42]